MAIKPTTNRQKPTLANVIRQHWTMILIYLLSNDHSHLQLGWDQSKAMQLNYTKNFVFCWSLMCNKFHHCYQWHCKNFN